MLFSKLALVSDHWIYWQTYVSIKSNCRNRVCLRT